MDEQQQQQPQTETPSTSAPAPAARAGRTRRAGGPRSSGGGNRPARPAARRSNATNANASRGAGADGEAAAAAAAAGRASSLSPPPLPPPGPVVDTAAVAMAQIRAAEGDPVRLLAARRNAIRMFDDRLAQIEREEAALKQHQAMVRSRYLMARVELQLKQASLLYEALRMAKSAAAGWGEVASLTRSRTHADAKVVASQLIGFAVAWRCCLRMRPTIFDELCDGEFAIEDLCVTARGGVRLSLDECEGGDGAAATGAATAMTPEDERVTLVPGFCFSRAVDEAIRRSAPRRAEEQRQKLALYMAIGDAMRRRRQVLAAPVTCPPLDEHMRSFLSRETIESVQGGPSTSGRA